MAAAFSDAKNHAFTLVVDCPVYVHVGSDISRPIFVEDGTSVRFVGNGLFITDNVFIPTWVIANSSQIDLRDWRVKYIGQLPVDPDTKGYVANGTFVPMKGKYQPAGAFHDMILTPWLTANRGIRFDRTSGTVTSPWPGPTGTSAVFYILGTTNSVKIDGMKIFVPERADGAHFVPVCFLTTVGFKSNQVITAAVPIDANSAALPSEIEVSNLELDGTYMGWLGSLKSSHFRNIRSFRYGDLQDDEGENVGGVGKWFAPPHLFYITSPKFNDLRNSHLEISGVLDWGQRVGVARDKHDANRSGYALSLKISASDSSVKDYTSYRPDGLLDLLPSERLVIDGLRGAYDSSFLNNIYPAVRFPVGPYHNVIIENVEVEDRAQKATIAPIGGILDANSSNVTLRNVNAVLHSPATAAARLPVFLGENHSIEIRIESN
ncbi:hypothetical protein IVA96_05430 [Bradyrhizobium sp. 159]|uniref:hypothetical protein n=1 Tax=Bradyrhizobium sp. 159 TaxID=2782632 RepID=UPI001FFC1481|nr:hypothetical protein [Bradyrhizobium sp. 159]MCK1616112.1 hypothetical protein [Bradyrhizobium sp. 159]